MEYCFKPFTPIFRFLKLNIIYIILVFLLFLLSKKNLPQSIFFSIGVLMTLQIPIFILFIQYYLNDYNSLFIFEKSKNRIAYQKKGGKITYTIDEVKLIELTATKARLQKNSYSFFWSDDFFYYTFFLNDGSSIIITSIILNGKMINEANFKNMNFKKKIKFYPSIY